MYYVDIKEEDRLFCYFDAETIYDASELAKEIVMDAVANGVNKGNLTIEIKKYITSEPIKIITFDYEKNEFIEKLNFKTK